MKLKERFEKKNRKFKRIVIGTLALGAIGTIVALTVKNQEVSRYLSAAHEVIEDLGGEPTTLIVTKVLSQK